MYNISNISNKYNISNISNIFHISDRLPIDSSGTAAVKQIMTSHGISICCRRVVFLVRKTGRGNFV